jgi:transcription-repair coupling factor (superfamily II helicase)
MQEVGFALYSEMLNKAVKSLKAGKVPDLAEPLAVTTEINLHAPALLPETYCPSIHERLVLYKRLAHCETIEALESLQEELVDRFGLMPDPARALIDSHRLRIEAKPLGIVKVDAGPDAIGLQFMQNPPVDPARIIQLIQTRKNFRLSGPERLRVEEAHAQLAPRVQRVRSILKELGEPAMAKAVAR